MRHGGTKGRGTGRMQTRGIAVIPARVRKNKTSNTPPIFVDGITGRTADRKALHVEKGREGAIHHQGHSARYKIAEYRGKVSNWKEVDSKRV